MKYIFFQANFCARCGNDLTVKTGQTKSVWTKSAWRYLRPSRLFCPECERALRRHRILRMIILAASLLTISFLARRVRPPRLRLAPPTPVSALDATPLKNPVYQFEEEEKSFCGALTRKGTPCRRLVRRGERCSLHRRSGSGPGPDPPESGESGAKRSPPSS